MLVSLNSRIVLFFVFTTVILEGDTKRPNLKEGNLPERRDYRPSKWVANSAMDVWYGNKSMIDVISREFSDIMYKLTARPVRSTYRIPKSKDDEMSKNKEADNKDSVEVSRVAVTFYNAYNETIDTIDLLQSIIPPLNTTIDKE